MSRHKHKLRFIGIFLSVILSVSSVPLYAFASGTYDTGGAAAEEVTVSCEYVAKRGEFEKHYLLSDGSFVAVSYPEAIHYRNADGEWEDIDSSLHAEASSSRIVTGDCGTFAASFSTGRRAGRLVSLSNREFSLSWSLSGDGDRIVSSSPVLAASSSSVMQARAKISDSITGKPVSDSETFALRGASGSVGYSALFADAPEISAEYTVYRNKIEEDIYINSPTDLRSLRMEFDTAGLTAEVRDDGSVEFLDENGEMRFRIGIPYMEDAANEILTDIHVNAEQNGDSCTVTYTPDEEWLSSSERSYPILFDPSVTTDEYNSNIVDTYVAEGDTANHSGEQKLFYGVKSGKIHRVYIKINDLPAIDASMPVYSATMSLTYLTGTKTGKAVEIFKVNSVWSPATITYDAQPFYSFLYRTTFDASKPVTFDLTSDVPKLYNGYSNNGYLIKYVDEGKDNPDYNGFWSSEYTTASKRPVLTVKYGYSLPSFLTNGSVYSFQNVGSGSFMTVHNGKDANYTNVYQKNTTVASLTASQKFRIEQVSSTGGYLLRAMCSSDGTNRVVDIQRVGTENFVKSGNNAYLYTATAPKTQQWFIVGVGTNQFKIVLRSNMNLALTAYGTADGTSGGTSSTSAGNVFLSTYSDSNYQKWKIIDSYGDAVRADDFIFNGTYYINNISSGKFIQNKSTGLCGVSGLVKRIGTSIKWKITPVGKAGVVQCYVIQPVSDTSQYLAAHSLLASQPSLEHISSTDISDNFKWVIDGSGIRNVASNKYLRFKVNADGTYDVELSSTRNTESRWRVVKTDKYRELSSDFSIDHIPVEYSKTKSILINDGGAFWASPNDFNYSYTEIHNPYYEKGYATLNHENSSVTGLKYGSVTIMATHKVTLQTTTFEVRVLPCGGMFNFDIVSNHDYELLNNGKYCCKKCNYMIASPALQDEDILSDDDLLKVYTLNIAASLLYQYNVDELYGIYGEAAYKVALKMIDDIRAKEEYKGKYRYSGEDLMCLRMYESFYQGINLLNTFAGQTCTVKRSINAFQAMECNGLYTKLTFFVLGLLIDDPLAKAILSTTQFEPQSDTNCLEVLDMISDVLPPEIASGVSTLLNIKTVASLFESECAVGDTVIEFEARSLQMFFRVRVILDKNENIKSISCKAEYDHGII